MRRRNPNPRLAKSRRTYSVAEIAELYGCHRGTVRNWLNRGLEPIDSGRPTLVLGRVLNEFHRSRRDAAKRPCGPAEIYCAPCHQPRRPAGDVVDCIPVNAKVWKVSGHCPDCGRALSQRVGTIRLAQFRASVAVRDTKPQTRLEKANAPSVFCDSEKEESDR